MEKTLLQQSPILAQICKNLTFEEAVELMMALNQEVLECEISINDKDARILTLPRVDSEMILLHDLIKERGSTSALVNAIELGDQELIQILLNRGANINANAENGHTALTMAVMKNNLELVRELLNRGADPNEVKRPEKNPMSGVPLSGIRLVYTPLMLASIHGYVEIVEELLKHSAKVGITNIEGRTALDYAMLRQNFQIAEILRQHGAQ